MKKALLSLLAIMLVLTSIVGLTSCKGNDEKTHVCQHRDTDDNSLCDKCSESYTDGKDVEDTLPCQHRDVNDDSLCDKCSESYTDGKDVEEHTHNYVSDKCTICGDVIKYSEGLKFSLNDDNTYSVVGIGDCTDTDIVIPRTYNGAPVTSINDFAFFNCKNLINVIIPDSVTSIGGAAFYDCNNLNSIKISNSVTSIGSLAFYDCDNLNSIIIPDSVTSIGSMAFYHCYNLNSIIIPNSVTSIGDEAFSGCKLTSVTIPHSITNLGSAAFSCDSLTIITVDESNPNYKSIDGNLYSKDGKTLIQYANGKTETSFVVPYIVTSIGTGAFSCNNLTSITIPDSVTNLGSGAFSGCHSLTDITIPNSVTSIGSHAFYGCTSLRNIKYCGTELEWNAIQKDGWDTSTGDYTITYNYTGE